MAINTDSFSDCGIQRSGGPEEVSCDYPKKKLENIKKNQEMMKALEALEDEKPFTRFVEENVLTTEVPNYRTRRSLRLATANNQQYGEKVLSDENDDLFCDDCNDLYHGECPVHGPLSELDPAAGYDKASLAYTQLPVPAQLTVRSSVIPGAGLGVFAVSLINKAVRFGPYEGRKVAREDVGDLHNTDYAWEIRHEGIVLYFIDGQDFSHSNWMRFVNCARNEDEQNILAYQCHGNIYYRTFKTIYPNSELLVWYGKKYAKELGIHPNTAACIVNFCCRGCGGSFSEEASFQIHLKYSSTCARAHPQTFTCLKCQQHFTQLECLQQHIRKHGELAQDKQCSYCGKSFDRMSHLQVHIRTHTGEEPYKCQYCGKSFKQSGNLQVHIRTHTGEKPYKCEYCAKSFNLRNNLQEHTRTHTGEKPYKCEHCGKSFNHRSCLQRHLKTHTGEKPYKCEHCGKSFNQKSSLQRHLKTHTGEKPYMCEYCGKSFNQRGSVQKHIKTHTRDES